MLYTLIEGSVSSFILQVEEQDQRRNGLARLPRQSVAGLGEGKAADHFFFFKGSFIYL